MSEIDLSKRLDQAKDMVLNIKKANKIENVQMQVAFAIDISQSMQPLFSKGSVQKVFERVVPICLGFDPDGAMQVYPFHDGVNKCGDDCTVNNLVGYVQKEILKRFQFGGTNYAPAINRITKDFLSESSNVQVTGGTEKKSGGLFGMFKKSEVVPTTSVCSMPTLCIFITDGENFDKQAAEEALINASAHGIHFVFIGLGGATFNFLRKLDDLEDRVIDNATFFQLSESQILGMSDNELYSKIMLEIPKWLADAKAKGIVK